MVNTVAVRLTTEGTEQVRAALVRLGADGEAALRRIKFDTSTTDGAKALNATMQEGQSIAAGYASQLGPLGNIVGGLGGWYLAAAAGAAVLVGTLYASTKAAEEEAQAQARVGAILRATGDQSGVTSDQVNEMAERIAHSTNFTREEVLKAAGALAVFGNIGKTQFGEVLDLAAEMSAAFGRDLTSSVEVLGKAFEDPIQGMERLKRANVILSPEQKEVIRNFQEQGDLMSAQGALADDLRDKLGNVAEEMHTGLTGATHDLTQAWHEMLIELGKSDQVGGTISEVFEGLAIQMNAFNSALRDNKGLWEAINRFDKAGEILDKTGAAKYKAPPEWAHWDVSAGNQTEGDAAAKAAAEKQSAAISQIITDAIKDANLDASGGPSGSLQRFLEQHLKEIAKKNETNVDALKNAPGYDDLVGSLTKDFNAQNSGKTSKAADHTEEVRKRDLTDQADYLQNQITAESKADASRIAAQDKFNLEMLKGQDGYYSAAKIATSNWADAQRKIVDSEESAAIAALSKKEEGWERDKVKFDEYEKALTAISNAANYKRLQIDEEVRARELALQRESQGALFSPIQKGAESLNLSLKSTAADGLKSLGDGLLGVMNGTEKVGKAFDNLALTVITDLEKIILEEQIIAPIAKELNSLIDSIGGASGAGGGGLGGLFSAGINFVSSLFGSAKGNAFDGGNIVPFANGGILGGPVIVPMALMGEAGPEAIMPLKRGTDGKLGVAGSGGIIIHAPFAPIINIGGSARQEDVDMLRAGLQEVKRDHFQNTVEAIVQARSRRIIP